MSLEELFEIDIIVFADQEHFAVEVMALMLGVSAREFDAYIVPRDLAAAANPVAVAYVQADCESVTLIDVVKPVSGTAVTEMATTSMYFVATVAALKLLVVAACVNNDCLYGCLGCQACFQTVVTLVHYFLTVVDIYLLDCFADSVVDAASGISVCHRHCSVAQDSDTAVGKESVVDSVNAAVAVGGQSAAFLAFVSENQETYSQNFAQVVVCWNFG